MAGANLQKLNQVSALLSAVAGDVGIKPMRIRIASAADGNKLLALLDREAGRKDMPESLTGTFSVAGLEFYWAKVPLPPMHPAY